MRVLDDFGWRSAEALRYQTDWVSNAAKAVVAAPMTIIRIFRHYVNGFEGPVLVPFRVHSMLLGQFAVFFVNQRQRFNADHHPDKRHAGFNCLPTTTRN